MGKTCTVCGVRERERERAKLIDQYFAASKVRQNRSNIMYNDFPDDLITSSF